MGESRSMLWLCAVLAVTSGTLALPGLAFAQELETESARLLANGAVKAGAGFELQTSSEGTESAAPLFAEVGIAGFLELVVEPVVFASVNPKSGPSVSGVGDIEVTLVGLVLAERPWFPAFALAAEVKIPTARNSRIGTGEADYTAYLIFSKRFGPLDTHLNFGYAIIGQPPGTQVNNIFTFAAAAKLYLGDRVDLFAEVLGNTASSPEAEGEMGTGTGASLELAGGELMGTIGAGFRVMPSVLLSLGLSYDNNNAVVLHPGITIQSKLF